MWYRVAVRRWRDARSFGPFELLQSGNARVEIVTQVAFQYRDLATNKCTQEPTTCRGIPRSVQITRRGPYWIASARCAVSIRSLPPRSAIVRASLRMRW